MVPSGTKSIKTKQQMHRKLPIQKLKERETDRDTHTHRWLADDGADEEDDDRLNSGFVHNLVVAFGERQSFRF